VLDLLVDLIKSFCCVLTVRVAVKKRSG